MPPDRAIFAVGQRFDLRVEATADGGPAAAPPSGLTVTINGEDITARNILDAGASGGERGAGGVGATGGIAGGDVEGDGGSGVHHEFPAA